ncbi:MAG: hypothetical protein ACRCST_08645 [Turicibacter sp.]
MKKIGLIGVSLICMCMVGCSKTKVEKAQSLKEAYFAIGQKIENNEELTPEYVSGLLTGYPYEMGELFVDENTKNELQLYNFENAKEKLIISDSKVENKKLVEISYEVTQGLNTVYLAISPTSGVERRNVNVSVGTINLLEEVSKITDKKDLQLLNAYNEIAKDFATDKNLTIADIIKMTGITPTSEDTVDANGTLELTYYSFTTNNEILSVHVAKEEDKINRVGYGLDDQVFFKDTIEKKLVPPGEELFSRIITYVEDLAIQEDILNTVFESIN